MENISFARLFRVIGNHLSVDFGLSFWLRAVLLVSCLGWNQANAQLTFNNFHIESCRCTLNITGNTVHIVDDGTDFHDRDSTRANNNRDFRFADVDSDAGTFNSSTAGFTLMPGQVLRYMSIHWGGRGATAGNPLSPLANTAMVSFDGGTTYTTITADIFSTDSNASNGEFFTSTTDITALFNANGVVGVNNITLANVQLVNEGDAPNNIGGWTIQYIIEDPAVPFTSNYLFETAAFVANQTTNFTVSGLFVPLGNSDGTAFTLMGGDGDLGRTDTFLIDRGDGTGFQGLNDPLHPANDTLNTRATIDGGFISDNALFPRTPNHDRDVVDIIRVDDPAFVIPGGTTSIDIEVGTTSTSEGVTYHAIGIQIPSLPIEYGDAPDTYGTTIASNGASHAVPDFDADLLSAPLRLGATIDSEIEGAASPLANGDDISRVNDEDGVVFPAAVLAGTAYTQDVTANNLSVSGDVAFVNAWVDLNQNGVFDAAEQVLTNQVVPNALATTAVPLSFTTPASFNGPRLFARVRICGPDALGVTVSDCQTPVGFSNAGEVEDYVINTAQIELIKSITGVTDTNGNGFTDVGDTVEYSFSVTNNGSVTLSPVTVSDARLGIANAACDNILAPGDTAVCSTTASYPLTQADIEAGGVENTAVATGTPVDAVTGLPLTDESGAPLPDVMDISDTGVEPTDGDTITPVADPGGSETDDADGLGVDPTNPQDDNDSDAGNDVTVFLVTPMPMIELIKSAGPITEATGNAFVDAGDTILYTFEVFNTGNVSVELATTINDALLAGATPPVTVTCPPDTIVAPGSSTTACVANGPYTLAQRDIDAGGVENTSTLDATGVSSTGDPLIDPTTGAPYDPSVVGVTDTSDTGTDADGNPVADPSEEETDDIDGVGVAGGPASDDNDADNGNDPTPVLIPLVPSIELIKSIASVDVTAGGDPALLDVGDEVTFEFEVINTGNTALASITINDPGLPGIVLTQPAGTFDGDLAVGEGPVLAATGLYTITQTDVDNGGIENVATVESTPVATDPATGDPDPGSVLIDPSTGAPYAAGSIGDDSDTGTEPELDASGNPVDVADPGAEETPDPVSGDSSDGDTGNDPTNLVIPPVPNIELVKSVSSVTDTNSNGITDVGDEVIFSFSVTNTGNVALADVVVTDTSLPGITVLGNPIPSLAIDATDSTTVTATYALVAADLAAGGIENTATAEGNAVDSSGNTIEDPSNPGSPLTVSDDSDAGTSQGGDPNTAPDTTVSDPSGEETPSLDGSFPGDGDDNDPTVFLIAPAPELGVVKSASVGTLQSDGTADITFTILVENTGNVTLTPLTLIDDMTSTAALGSAFNGVVSPPVVSGVAVNTGTVLPTTSGPLYNGTNNLITGTDGTLVPGDSYQVVVVVNVNPSAAGAPADLFNSATGGGAPEGGGTAVTDDSNSGTDPNGDATGETPSDNAGGAGSPTPVVIPTTIEPSLIISKNVAGTPVDLGGGLFRVTYNMVIENDGNVDFTNLQVTDDLIAMTNNPVVSGATVSNASVSFVSGTVVTPNPAFTGTGVNDLLVGNDVFPVGAIAEIALAFDFEPDSYFGPFNNVATVSGIDPTGTLEEDNSENAATPTSTNGGGDFSSETPFILDVPSTPITLGWFVSQVNPDLSIQIDWQTDTEVANAGFELIARGIDGEDRQLNDSIILSQGESVTPQRYSMTVFVDYDVAELILVDVSQSGSREEHGPFKVGQEYGSLNGAGKAIDWDSINQESEEKEALREQQRRNQLQQRINGEDIQSMQSTNRFQHFVYQATNKLGELFAAALFVLIPTAEAVELVSFDIETEGLYQVTHSQLRNAGIDLRGVAVSRIGLKESNELWPVLIETNGSSSFTGSSRLIFPTRAVDTLYTGSNKYTLVLDEGNKLIQSDDRIIPGANVALASSYLEASSYAPQNVYSFITPETGDSWFADALNAVRNPVSRAVNLAIDNISPPPAFGANVGNITRQPVQQARLEVSVWGASSIPGDGVREPDHHVLVAVDDEQVSDVRFDGLQHELINVNLNTVTAGTMKVEVTVPNDLGNIFDLIRLDEITLYYPRKFNARGSALVFNSDWSKFRVKGVSPTNARVVRLDENNNAFLMTERGQGSCSSDCVYFAGDNSGVENTYYVASNAGLLRPDISVAVDSNLDWDAARYLVIAHPDFIGTGQRLLESFVQEMEAQYGSADLVDVQNIYAAFSGGLVDPHAIRAYLQEAFGRRGTRHLLLVGGDVYDYRNYEQSGARSFIPSIYQPIANNVNSIPSDSSYGLIDDDLVQDISVSRLPVRSTQDLSVLIQKRRDYLARSYNRTALMVADRIDSSNYSFKSDAQRVVFDHFRDWQVNEVYLDDQSLSSSRTSIQSTLNGGVALASYFGHSSADRWSLSSMLTGNDVENLTNFNAPTVVTQWGCWNTFYVSPENDSMAHRMLLDGPQGAVTVMGAASLTQAVAERRMAGFLFRQLRQGRTIGDAVVTAKRQIATSTPHQLDILLGWTVLGFDDMPIFSNQ